jgi:hypothetical protein
MQGMHIFLECSCAVLRATNPCAQAPPALLLLNERAITFLSANFKASSCSYSLVRP